MFGQYADKNLGPCKHFYKKWLFKLPYYLYNHPPATPSTPIPTATTATTHGYQGKGSQKKQVYQVQKLKKTTITTTTSTNTNTITTTWGNPVGCPPEYPRSLSRPTAEKYQ